MTQPKNKELKRLQKIWYKKLEKEGFDDIEQTDGHLKSWHSMKFQRHSNTIVFRGPYIEEYYRLAGYFLHEFAFENEIDKEIWTLHADGISIRNITKALRSAKNKKKYGKCVNTKNVNLTLQSLMKQMMELYRSRGLQVSLKEIS